MNNKKNKVGNSNIAWAKTRKDDEDRRRNQEEGKREI